MYTTVLYFLLSTYIVPNQDPQLTIMVENIEVLDGYIRVGVFNTSDTFLKKGATFEKYKIAVEDSTETIIIDDLPKGEYAFILYHDKNSDGKMNRKFIGIPKEPYGFSNNIRPKLSKPTFEECKFLLDDNLVMNIKLGYYK